MGKAFNQVAMTWRMNRDFFVFCGIGSTSKRFSRGAFLKRGEPCHL